MSEQFKQSIPLRPSLTSTEIQTDAVNVFRERIDFVITLTRE